MRAHRVLRCGIVAAILSLGLGSPRGVQAGFDDNGWIVDWLVYGPLVQSGGAAPTLETIGRDYLTDGVDFFEATILPDETTEVIPDFAPGVAASEGFHDVLLGEIAVWQPVNTIEKGSGDTVNFATIYGSEPINAIFYSVVYIDNPSDSPIDALVELGSDDSIQVKLDDCEVFALSFGRGFGAVNEVQNSAPITISPGAHRLLVKVFNGGGPTGFRLRLADAETGTPITDVSDPFVSVSLDPLELSVPEITPVGLTVSHTAAPDRLLGFANPTTVTITAAKSFPDLSDDALVTVTETLIPDTVLVAGSAVPAPTTMTASTLSWTLKVGDLIANGIEFDLKFEKEGSGCLSGQFTVGEAACLPAIGGKACSAAIPLNAIFLGDIVGGGDGSGTKSDLVSGVRLDLDRFLLQTEIAPENNDTNDLDEFPFQIIEDAAVHPDVPELDMSDAADFIDGTFLMPIDTIPINSAGVEYTFEAGDPNGVSWNHVLSNITHDIDKGVGNIRVAGREPFVTGIGIHASAGVTFDLDAIRAKYGADKVKTLVALMGVDGCGLGDPNCGEVNLYVIYSNEEEVLTDNTFILPTDSDLGEDYKEAIPAEATFLTLATGARSNGICCDHGVFAEARIFPELPTARITATPASGAAPLPVSFSGATSVTPAGTTITNYAWDFGDGGTATGSGAVVSHTYTQRGKYTATLSVTSSAGLTDTASTEVTATFLCGDVAPLISADVGDPTVDGCAREDGGCIVVFGGGRDIAARADQFQFVHKPKSGNVTVTAQIQSADFDIPTSGRAGIMFRSGTAADAAFAFMHVVPVIGGQLRATFLSRLENGLATAQKGSTLNFTPPNLYVRLERSGSELIGSVSSDGTTFTEVHRVTLVAPPAEMLAGLAVTGRDTVDRGIGAEITFCGLAFSDETGGDPVFHRGDADDNGSLQLTDALRILGFLFLGGPAPSCLDAGDADDNGSLQLTDALRVLGFLFLGGLPPSPPGPPGDACGPDPTTDDVLDCISYTNC